MQIDVLHEFAAVARTLNFTSAAQRCHITQSVLSRHMSALEKELGVSLFNRSSRGARLTAFGEVYAEGVEKMLAEHDAALARIRSMKNDYTGTLRIGYLYGASHAFLPTVHTRFCETHPETDVRLASIEGGKITSVLEANEIDIGIVMTDAQPNESWYTSHLIYDDFYGVVVHTSHPLACRNSIELSELANETVYIFDPGSFHNQWSFLKHQLEQQIPEATVKDLIHDAIDIPMFAKNHRAMSIVPSHLLFALDIDGLRFIPIHKPYLSTEIRAIWKKSKESPALLGFIDCLKAVTEGMSTETLRNCV